MTEEVRVHRYRKFFERLGEARALPVLDTLQVLALTSPETLRELETFMDRGGGPESATGRRESGSTPASAAGVEDASLSRAKD